MNQSILDSANPEVSVSPVRISQRDSDTGCWVEQSQFSDLLSPLTLTGWKDSSGWLMNWLLR